MATTKIFENDDEALAAIDRLISEGWIYLGNIFESDKTWHLVFEKDGHRADVGSIEKPLQKLFFPKDLACAVAL